ncbi:MAG: FtsX-like permease family protein [Acidobacteriota bacterium]
MSALTRKLLRDLWQIKGQALAIAAVIGTGLAMFVAYMSTFASLQETQQAYYAQNRFADVFANLKRAPDRLEGVLAEIPGVAAVATRVVVEVNLEVPDEVEPVTGRLVSIPEIDRPTLNDVTLVSGRYPESDRPDEVLVNEAFALARGAGPGDEIAAIINGRRRELEIVGVALSPEYVFTMRPGELLPDDSRFGIFWMARDALAAAYDMEGGFNDVALALEPTASVDDVIRRLDDELAVYGGLGALPRSLQISDWYLSAELSQLQGFGTIVPSIFLGVAIFLLNVVMTRIVTVQREQIAALKALGYHDREVGLHFALWGLAIAAVGTVGGLAFGRWLGAGMLGLYNSFYRFPILAFHLPTGVVMAAVAVAMVAALIGSASAVRSAVRLPPAEAMRPEPPARFRRSLVERFGLGRILPQPARIVLRNLERRPGRAFASILGVGFSGGLLIIGLFFFDAIDEIMRMQFERVERHNVTINFFEPRGSAAAFEVERLPGVIGTEPARDVAVRLRHGHRHRRTALLGLDEDPWLRRVVDTEDRAYRLPAGGLLLSTKMAEVLGVEVGDRVVVEVLEGRRPRREIEVASLVEEYMGTNAYVEIDTLHRLMREAGVQSGAYLLVDPLHQEALYRRLRELPAVAGVKLKSAAIESFRKQMDETMGIFIGFNILFASIITFGVMYNAARVTLSERSRELASLRVLGFTRGEISFILLGELAVVVLLALPLGAVIGHAMAGFIVTMFNTELYRFPLVVSRRSVATAMLVVVGAAVVSSLVVRRRLDHLDLVEVLKTRE